MILKNGLFTNVNYYNNYFFHHLIERVDQFTPVFEGAGSHFFLGWLARFIEFAKSSSESISLSSALIIVVDILDFVAVSD